MFKLTILFAIVAAAQAGFLNGNNHGLVEESFSAPLALPAYAPAPIYGAPAPVFSAPAPIFSAPAPIFSAPAPILSGPAPVYGAPLRTASFAAPAPIAFPAPSYAAPIIKSTSFAAPIRTATFSAPAPIGVPAQVYGPPPTVFRASAPLAYPAAPAPIYGAPAALPISSGYSSW